MWGMLGKHKGTTKDIGEARGSIRNKGELIFSTRACLCKRGMCYVNCKCGNARGKELMH